MLYLSPWCLVGEALYADVLEAAVGDGFSHLIQLGAK